MGNEITVKLNCGMQQFCSVLESKGFQRGKEFVLDDTFFVPVSLAVQSMSIREILRHAVLLRVVTQGSARTCKLTFKRKQIAEDGTILSQDKVNCEILRPEEGERFLQAIGYSRLMRIVESDIVYKQGALEIAIKDIEGGEPLAEIETAEATELETIEALKQRVLELNLPIDTTDFFVKKAEIALERAMCQK